MCVFVPLELDGLLQLGLELLFAAALLCDVEEGVCVQKYAARLAALRLARQFAVIQHQGLVGKRQFGGTCKNHLRT